MRTLALIALTLIISVVVLHDAPFLAMPLLGFSWAVSLIWTVSKTRMAARLALWFVDTYRLRTKPTQKALRAYGKVVVTELMGPEKSVGEMVADQVGQVPGQSSVDESFSAFVMPVMEEMLVPIENGVIGQARVVKRVVHAARTFLESNAGGCAVIALTGAKGSGKSMLAMACAKALVGEKNVIRLGESESDAAQAERLQGTNPARAPLAIVFDGITMGFGTKDSPCGAWLASALAGDWPEGKAPKGMRLVFVVASDPRVAVADDPTSEIDAPAWDKVVREAAKDATGDLGPLVAEKALLVERCDPHTNLGYAALAALRIRRRVQEAGLDLASRGVNTDILVDTVRAAHGAFGGPGSEGDTEAMFEWIDRRLEPALRLFKEAEAKDKRPVQIIFDPLSLGDHAQPAWFVLGGANVKKEALS